MEVHQLRYFARLAELGSFTRAAEACHVSQPSLSQQIQKLESELGRPLFERLGRRALLTESGRRLKPVADQVLSLIDGARDLVNDDPEAARLVVGAPPTVVPYFLAGVLDGFARAHPRARLEVVEDVTESIVSRLLEFELDLAVLPLPIDHAEFDVEPLFDEELLVLLPAGHRLADRPRVSIRDLQSEPFILLHDAHCLSGNALSFCHQKRLQPIVTSRVSQLATIQELVSLGRGISLVPEMARRLDADPSRVYRSLSGARPRRTIGLVRHARRSPSLLAGRFSEALRAAGPRSGR
ncbi:LysR family transcriptional regulator [Tautonia plasticadhaerens]|uniref:Hydrogen peroxide-inducible genes activator n=1 Tax=Tautonia plasticadhaerens TaxID=2527974 RepID=A0A518GUE5_9BACT|nr:LysR family transcriptional regulator [Tautonia plasticadhaerens]QDV32219.1 Hydrogen peroxide-inducible genes activator [Tautonia plasticadhaerens]